ncbi:MAG: LAGLIDADG family homing endonuclease [Candidatus Aenigmatarchaeota archaeon]
MINKDVAELVGVHLGDGRMSHYFARSEDIFRFEILFTGDWDKDSRYYKEVLQPIVIRNFGIKGHIKHRRDDDTVRYVIKSKKLATFFVRLEIPVGKKAEICKIPSEVICDIDLSIACIRGIFNSDGSIYRRYNKRYKNTPEDYYKYAVVQFKMKSKDLIKQIKDVLNSLHIRTTKISRNCNSWVLRITHQKSIDIFFDLFKINHNYHLKRYNDIRSSLPKATGS